MTKNKLSPMSPMSSRSKYANNYTFQYLLENRVKDNVGPVIKEQLLLCNLSTNFHDISILDTNKN